MPYIPYPITAESTEELKAQLYEMLRQLFEDKIGGLDLGDVFLNSGDILSLRLATSGGLEKSSNELQVKIDADGGLTTSSSGAAIVCKASGGLATDSSGLYLSASGGANFATIACPAGTNPIADKVGDTLTLLAGTGVTITGDETTDSVTIAAHARQHSITSTSDHTSTATSGKLLKADSNGLPVDATNTDSQVSTVVGYVNQDVTTTGTPTFAEETIFGISRLGALRVGDATNNTFICASGLQTYHGNAKVKLTLRPGLVEKSTKAGGTPTQVIRGVNIGYSLPIWSDPVNLDEELYWRLRIPVRWDGITDPQFGIAISLASAEDVGDNFKLSLEWQTTNKGAIIGTTTSVCYSEQTVLTGQNSQYSTYFIFFTIDADDSNNPITHGEMLQARIRRIDATDPDITGEVIVWDWASIWPCDKTYGPWTVSANKT